MPGANSPPEADPLALALHRLGDGWAQRHGHPVLLVESFADTSRVLIRDERLLAKPRHPLAEALAATPIPS